MTAAVATVDRASLERFAALVQEAKIREERRRQSARGGLLHFVRYFWDILEPQTPLVEGWTLEAICEHLEAVSYGEITRLLVNVPPGFMKSLLTNVFWPAWEWSALGHSHLRYVTFSYAATLTERDNGRFRDLVTSRRFRTLWGAKFSVRNTGVTRVTNDKTGWKLASSVGGVGTGERGNRVILDDPHNVKEAESETVRTETVRWFEEAMSNRLNDLAMDAIIVIMQRVHETDVSGSIIEGHPEYVHLCIPMEYEADRHCETEIGWSDPREEDGEPAWPERFGPDVLEPFKRRPYVWAGQYQQRPEPRGGGIFKRDWWQEWDPKDGKFPSFEYMVASLDTAYTTKQENDPSALTIWGVFRDMNNNPKVMLCAAWRERLELNPLVEKVASSCRRFKVDRLLIESKAAGISVAQEIRRLHAGELWGIQLVDPKGADKVARAYAVQHLFEDGLVHAPNREWADMVIDEMASFPRAAHDDLCDTATQALKHLRSIGLAVRKDERQAEMQRAMQYKRPSGPLYPMV